MLAAFSLVHFAFATPQRTTDMWQQRTLQNAPSLFWTLYLPKLGPLFKIPAHLHFSTPFTLCPQWSWPSPVISRPGDKQTLLSTWGPFQVLAQWLALSRRLTQLEHTKNNEHYFLFPLILMAQGILKRQKSQLTAKEPSFAEPCVRRYPWSQPKKGSGLR